MNAKRNASYKSPKIQNEIIALAGLEVKQRILDDAKAARWFSLMADECTDVSMCKQMAICIRFVDETSCVPPEIREEFLGFVELEHTNAEHISDAILKFLADCDLELDNLRGWVMMVLQ